MEITRQLQNQHLLWRAGFGPSAASPDQLDMHPHKLYKQLEKAALKRPGPLDAVSMYIRGAMVQPQATPDMQIDADMRKKISAEQRRIVNRQSNLDIRQLTLDWMDQMVNSEAQLREKMALFWHGHFACRINNSLYQQLLLNTIRQYALENFGDLLRAVSKSASMLQFLNNQQNRKRKPNENFAREVMELFTMGRDNYTETDIKEAARAFTGWSFQRDGSFVFNEKQHDDGIKTILGSSGNFTGDDVLDILLKQKQTARYLTRKIYRFFVNEEVNEVRLNRLAEQFYADNYDIARLMRAIFTSEWFYAPENIGNHIKSPVEYLAGIRRQLPMTLQNPEMQVLLQRLLGQWLFNPPNVAGWPGGTAWIDSSSLMLRLRIPGLLKNDETIHIKPKGNDDVEMGRKEMIAAGDGKAKKAGSGYRILARIDWNSFINAAGTDGTKPDETYRRLEALLLQTPPGSADKASVMSLVQNSTPQTYTESLAIAFMSTPEYQLC